jgi:two-component system, LytTR family, response regulator
VTVQTISHNRPLTLAVVAGDVLFQQLKRLCGECGVRALQAKSWERFGQLNSELAAVLIDADGFGLPEATDLPVIVMSHKTEQAVRAFDIEAIDFLLKPIGSQRLFLALKKLRTSLVKKQHLTSSERQVIPLEVGRNTELVDQLDIDYLSVHSNYVSVFVNRREFVTRNTLESMQASLDPTQFLRVHRSYVVQLSAVQTVQKLTSDRFALHLRSGEKIHTSRSVKEIVRRRLGLVA